MTSNSQSGLSLVEVLIVLVIVAVMSSVAILSIGAASRGATAEAEAMRLASRLRLAMDEALVTDLPIGLSWDANGYGFGTGSAEKSSREAPKSGLLDARYDLSDRLKLESDAKETPVSIEPDGDGPAATFILSDSSSRWSVTMDGFSAVAAPLGPR